MIRTNTRLYRIWTEMKRRCFSRNRPNSQGYIKKGITICDEWLSFDTFYKWAIENGYKDDLSIDRINNDGNYEPSNCRWANQKTQANNTSTCHYITHNGKTQTITLWAEEIGLNVSTLSKRLVKYGWSVKDALTIPKLKGGKKHG